MGFRDDLDCDVGAVFLDPEAFGEEIVIDGRKVRAVVDDSHASVSLKSMQGLSDASGLGLLSAQRTLYIADTFSPRPFPEQLLTVNGERWQVSPDATAVRVEMGLLVVELQRVYS